MKVIILTLIFFFNLLSWAQEIHESKSGLDWVKVTDDAGLWEAGGMGAVAFKDKLWLIGGAAESGNWVMFGIPLKII